MKKFISSLTVATCLVTGLAATVFTGCSGDKYHRSTGAYLDDKSVAAKIKADLIGDSEVKSTDVKVNVFRGDVQLSGFVDTPEQKMRAEQIARNVNGVNFVKNDLVVKTPNEPAGSQNIIR